MLSSGFTAPVNATMAVGGLAESVVVSGVTPTVDVQNARQAVTFDGDQIQELPTARNVNSLLQLTPGISSNYRAGQGFGEPGICVGGIGVFCNPGLNGFNVGDNDPTITGGDRTTNLQQGRVLVDGVAVNGGAVLPLGGLTNGYTADIAAAQEINIQLSGGLGESETGGASINIIPRTGGNRFAGNWNTTYTRSSWFDRNNDAFQTGCNTVPLGVCVTDLVQPVKFDYDYGGAFGGPIKRDRLWFYAQGRDQGIQKVPGRRASSGRTCTKGSGATTTSPTARSRNVEYRNIWKNISGRFTYQATQKNKFNFFWDEQDFCQDPCLGVVSVFTSPESWWSVAIKPNRLQQVTWTNPLTSRILLEAGLTVKSEHYDTTLHREYRNPTEIPRVDEFGDTAGMPTAWPPRVNQSAGNLGFNLTSGSLASGIAGGGAEARDNDSYRTRASMSYVSGGAPHEDRVGRRLLHAGPDQPDERLASVLPLLEAGHDLRDSSAAGDLPVREHQPAVPGGSVQPGAAAGSAERAVLHRRRHRPRSRLVRRALRPGSVDAPALHVQRRAALRPRREPVSGDLHRRSERAVHAGSGRWHEALLHARFRRRQLPRHHAAMGCGVGRLRHRPDVGEVEHGQVQQPGGDHRDLLRRQPGAAHGQRAAARLERHSTATASLTAT